MIILPFFESTTISLKFIDSSTQTILNIFHLKHFEMPKLDEKDISK